MLFSVLIHLNSLTLDSLLEVKIHCKIRVMILVSCVNRNNIISKQQYHYETETIDMRK